MSLLKYLLEGLVVGIATYLIPHRQIKYTDITMIALTAAAIFAVLDQFSPLVAAGARHGTGFSIGYQQVGLGQETKPESKQETKQSICQMSERGCSYSPTATQDDQQKFTCKDHDGQCTAEENEVEGFDGFK